MQVSRFAGTILMVGSLAAASRADDARVSSLSEIERAQGFVSMFNGTREDFQKNFVTYKQGDTTNAVLNA